MARTLILSLVLLNCGLPISVSTAQLFRGNVAPPAAREPARAGLLGGMREARDERFRREEQAAIAAGRAAAAQRSSAGNAPANPLAGANPSAQQPAGALNNNLLRRDAPNTAMQADANSRTANFRGANGINASNSLSRPTPVTPASASIPGPVSYRGPGVAIRLPKEARSVVNYLVDESEAAAIRPGEQQVLEEKGTYVVRYSRGVTADGRSFGESRYTITEGRYRFELTPTGWELYRESGADTNLAPPNQLEIAENRVMEGQSLELPIPQPSMQSELQRPLANQSATTSPRPAETPRKPLSIVPTANDPVASEPVVNEEVLPAPKPRSILE